MTGLVWLQYTPPSRFSPSYLVFSEENYHRLVAARDEWEKAKESLKAGTPGELEVALMGHGRGADSPIVKLRLLNLRPPFVQDPKKHVYEAMLPDHEDWEGESFTVVEKVG